jgi:hypothetical protein
MLTINTQNMKLILDLKWCYYTVLFLTVCLSNPSIAQDEGAEKPDDCWCKFTVVTEGMYQVYNVDSMIQKELPGWRNLIDCGCEDCVDKICVFERWECTGEVCAWVERSGICTDETFGSDIPWEGDGNGECNCMQVFSTPNYTFYTNINIHVDTQEPDDILQYTIRRECKADDCGSNKCIYTLTNTNTQTSRILEGECLEGWSDQKAKTALLDVDGNEVKMDQTLKFYPNPAKEELTIESTMDTKTTIFSLDGKIVMESTDKLLNLSQLDKGLYIIMIETKNGAIADELIVE